MIRLALIPPCLDLRPLQMITVGMHLGGSSQQSSNTNNAAAFQADFDNMNSTALAPPAPAPSTNLQVMVHNHSQPGDQG